MTAADMMLSATSAETYVLIIGTLLSLGTSTFFVIRHFWAKTKCFYLMQQRLEQLEAETEKGKRTHIEIFDRLNSLDKNYSRLEGKLDIIIDRMQ